MSLPRCLPSEANACWARVAGKVTIVAWFCLALAASASAQQPPVHFLHQGVMPPGAIGSQRLQRGGPVAGFFQPVEIRAPRGVRISMAEGGSLTDSEPTPSLVGLLIGQVYRTRVTNIPLHPGQEVFPTIEVVDRLYAPAGQETRFPIIVELTEDDLLLAMQGKFVTRVIYLEDPQAALPVAEHGGQTWFDVGTNRDPLAIADSLGRPVAILRLGGRVPDASGVLDAAFLFGCPPLVRYARPGETPQGVPGDQPAAATGSAASAARPSPAGLLR